MKYFQLPVLGLILGAAFAPLAHAGPDLAQGKNVYNQTCIACHGADGKGVVPGAPDFTKKDGRLTKSDEMLIQHITNGFQTDGSPLAMPAKGGNPSLTEEDIEDALAYIRQSFGS